MEQIEKAAGAGGQEGGDPESVEEKLIKARLTAQLEQEDREATIS